MEALQQTLLAFPPPGRERLDQFLEIAIRFRNPLRQESMDQLVVFRRRPDLASGK
jgi:hypothetical protein